MFHLATTMLKADQPEAAIEEFKRSESIKKSAAIFNGLGSCYHKLKDFEQAIFCFNRALEQEGTNIEYLKNRSQCYFDMTEYESCISDLSTALDIRQTDP